MGGSRQIESKILGVGSNVLFNYLGTKTKRACMNELFLH